MAEKPILKPGKSPGNSSQTRSNPSPENAKQSPLWLKGYEPSISPNNNTFIGFAEYLRWMRSPDAFEKNLANSTKLEILQLAAEKSDSYKQRLAVLTNRTKLIAGKENTFEVTSTWRIRVGGQRGPESMLLPAWDALGIPYIPSSTLRGVARDRAIREFMESGMNYDQATAAIAPYFGSIDVNTPREDRSGKVIFLDAYPVPADSGALAVDIANNIWKWEGSSPKYGASPQSFLSLKKPTFAIGIKPTQKCDRAIFERVKGWLIAGLQSGIGAQVNSGYGELLKDGGGNPQTEILRQPIEFSIRGQLIHGNQEFRDIKNPYKQDRRGNLQPDTVAISEVRPIAFRAMLRYWFRAFALGVLPPNDVKKLEAQLFGSIDPTLSSDNKPTHGWVVVNISDGKTEPIDEKSRDLKQSGSLMLRYSNSAPIDEKSREQIYKLLKSLTWLMFHLGGVGQGARRPQHQRTSNPYCRGSNLEFVDPEIIKRSKTADVFMPNFRSIIRQFYDALGILTNVSISPQSLQTVRPQEGNWAEAIDTNCCILICQGKSNNKKPYALEILHLQEFKIEAFKYGKQVIDYDPELCGKMQKPSPVWICDKGEYQVVTIFGAKTGKRKEYIDKLLTNEQTMQVFPLQ
jgi:CRISPR-associated protein Cmr6